MNKKNLILLIILGINLLVGLILFITDGSEPKIKYVPLAIFLGTFIGAFMCFWNIIGKIMGRSAVSFVVFIVVVFVSICMIGLGISGFKDGSKTALIISLIYLVLDVIYAIKCFLGLRIITDSFQEAQDSNEQ